MLALAPLLLAAAPLLDLQAPIKRWDEGIPLGSGLFGALVWGEGSTLRFSLDRGDLWDTRVPETFTRPDWTYETMVKLKDAHNHAKHVELFDVPYDTIAYPTKLPGGRLEVTLPPDVTPSRFSLDAPAGCAHVQLVHGSSDDVRALVDPTQPVLVVSSLPADCTIRLVYPEGLAKLGCAAPVRGADDTAQWYTQSTVDGTLSWAVCAAMPKSEHSEHGAGRTCAVAIVTNRDSKDFVSVARSLAARAATGKLDTESANKARYGVLAQAQVTLPDAEIQRQYELCRYYMMAASQPGSPPMPLQGVWTADEGGLPPWKGDYHNDLNTQTTYIAYQAANQLNEGLSFIHFLWELRPRFQRFAHDFYGVKGLVVPGVMGIDGAPLGGWGQYSLSPTHTAWLAQSFYMHWRYTMDRTFLEECAYPWCSDAGEAISALLKPDAQGVLRLALSSSPEIHDNSYRAWLAPNSNYDDALMMYLFDINERMARALKKNEDAAKWKHLRERLPALDTEADGTLTFAKGEPFAESHRHFSHAMAIHPLGIVNIEGTERERKIIAATLDRTQKLGTSAWCGYSFSWFSAMNARAGRADAAADYLRKFCTSFVSRNGFHLNGDQSGKGLSSFTYRPFTLEGNFLAMHAVHEMLLQSWGERIRIFPAVPESWKDVSFRGLLAEGAIEVAAERTDGQTRWVTLKARVDTTAHVVDPFAKDGTLMEVPLKAGETARLERR